jgi:hypothetical protein
MLKRRESGAAALFVAAAIVLLFGAAAVAVDVGAGFNERRGNQTAADTAAVAGLLWSLIGTSSNTLQEGLDEAKATAEANTRGDITLQAWTDCTDPNALERLSSNLGLTGGSPCISWNSSYTTMRVKIPTQPTRTTFGRVLGVSTLFTSAEAEASITGLGEGGSLPSGALGNAGGGTEICIKTGTGSAASESCGAPSTGDFQNFRPYFYAEVNPTTNPKSECVSGEQTDPMSRAFADGIDHFFTVAPALDAGLRENGDNCPHFPGPAFPDHVETAAGYQNTDITQGLVLGGDWDGAFDGRLERGPYLSNPSGTTVNGFEIFDRVIDNRPLWSYIDQSLALHPDCAAVAQLPDNPIFATHGPYTVGANSVFASGEVASWDDTKALMSACLMNQGGQLFDVDAISRTPRLASVPRFHETAPCPSNSCLYDIKDFVPVFIQDMWTAHSSQWTCTGEVIWVDGDHCRHQPGMTGEIYVAAPGQKRVNSASAFILKCGHFSDDVCKDVQTSTGGSATLIFDIRLTR